MSEAKQSTGPMKRGSTLVRHVVLIVCVVSGLAINAVVPFLLLEQYGFYPPYEKVLSGLFPIFGYIVIAGGVAFYLAEPIRMWLNVSAFGYVSSAAQDEIRQALERAKEEPEKAKPAWDLAQLRLERYFDRNLSQINAIFWVSVVVMLAGFVLVVSGITQAFGFALPQRQPEIPEVAHPSAFTPALVGTVAGIITEFIGATFLFIYRSTISQASTNMKTLERIHSVGMAMQILDTISKGSKELSDQTKAEIVKKIVFQSLTETEEDDSTQSK